MNELYLQFVDSDGAQQSVAVTGEFFIGRHSGCDLAIPDGSLSREHVKIEQTDDGFLITDLDSSNGTVLDGTPLTNGMLLEGEGEIVLGGSVRISYVVEQKEDETEEAEAVQPAPSKKASPAAVPLATGSGFGPVLFIAPILGLILLLTAGGAAIYFLGGETEQQTPRTRNGSSTSRSVIDSPDAEPSVEPSTSDTASPTPLTQPTVDGSPLPTSEEPTPEQKDTEGINRETEKLVYTFMRNIAKNDQKPYLKTIHFNAVTGRIAQFKGSGGLAANIRNASQNAAQLRTIAKSKNLEPEFLAAAALAKLGNTRGDVAATAAAMSDPLGKLTIVLSNELADDSLLVIAAYNEGVAGNTLMMRNRLANQATKNPTASPREIRTIWFLREKGEISAAQYDLALTFLAVGTIAQNPSAFGVNASKLAVK